MASLLHVERSGLAKCLVDLGKALRPGGLLYASFKHGNTYRLIQADGRAFTDLDHAGMRALLGGIFGLDLVNTAESAPPPEQTNAASWFSFVLRRPGSSPTLRLSPSRHSPLFNLTAKYRYICKLG
jgi:hypothetical protein